MDFQFVKKILMYLLTLQHIRDINIDVAMIVTTRNSELILHFVFVRCLTQSPYKKQRRNEDYYGKF